MNKTFNLGDVVEITGTYCKSHAGRYVVVDNDGAPGTPENSEGLTLHKITKAGNIKEHQVQFWPLVYTMNDSEKNAAAYNYDKKHASIKPSSVTDRGEIVKFFNDKIEDFEKAARWYDWNKEMAAKYEKFAEYYRENSPKE